MGLFDYIVGKAFNVPPEQLNWHECTNKLEGDMIPSLPPGTPVYCSLMLNIAEHSGISIGDKIVHLDGSGKIISSSPKEFLARLDGNNLAFNIYYAASAPNQPLAKSDIANRAQNALGNHRDYHVLKDNCHGFAIRCIDGKSTCHSAWSIREIEYAISKAFSTINWRWRCWDGWR